MAGYRFFFLGSDGHITGRAEQDCDGDLAALEHAATLATKSPVEVWDAARFVGRSENIVPKGGDRGCRL